MKEASKWWLLLYLSVLLAIFGGLWMISFDHSAKIAKAVLYDQKGNLNDQVITEALAVRFPLGSKLEDVQSFVEMLDGRCVRDQADVMRCSLVSSATLCVATTIEIMVAVSADGTLKHIAAKGKGQSC